MRKEAFGGDLPRSGVQVCREQDDASDCIDGRGQESTCDSVSHPGSKEVDVLYNGTEYLITKTCISGAP